MLKRNRFELGVALALTALIAYQLFISPPIGMADNGDFGRFLADSGLQQIPTEGEDNYFYYFNSKYRIVSPASGGYNSSLVLFTLPARWINIQLFSNEVFDVRVLGALYTVSLVFGVYLLLLAGRPLRFILRFLLAALILLILTDAGYIAYFNTFYAEPVALVAFVTAAGFALLLISRQTSSWMFLAGYFCACALLVTAKPLYTPLAVPFALFALPLSKLIVFKHRIGLTVSLAALLLGVSIWYYLEIPQWQHAGANYIGIFTDMLKHSPSPEQDLRELGLDPEWSRFAGTNPYSSDSPFKEPEVRAELNGMSSTTVPLFYLSRPSRLFQLLRRCSNHVFITRVWYLGYFEKRTGRPPRSQAFGLWSEIRNLIFPKTLWFIFTYFALAVAAAIFGILRGSTKPQRALAWFLGLFVVVGLGLLMTPILVMGENDLDRLLFPFTLTFDLSLILITIVLSGNIARRINHSVAGVPAGAGPAILAILISGL